MIFDPFSGNLDGTGRSVFSSGGQVNVIPQARLNGPMMKMLALVPLPNQPGDNDNYFNSGTQRLNRNNFDAKVNWNRNERHQLWFKYSVMDALVHGDFSLGEAGGDCLWRRRHRRRLHARADRGHRADLHRVARRFLIDGTFGWTRFGQAVEPPDLGTNFGSDVLGIPGTNGPDPRESGMPPMYMSGYSALGNPEGWNPLYRNDQSYTFNTNASWMKGAHDVRFGFDFVHHLMNHWQPELGEGPRGAFYFDPGVTALNPDALDGAVGFQGDTPSFENDWNGLAAFLLGTPDVSGKSSQFIKMNSFENQYALYIRDRWRATPKLTVDLGLRWELYPNRTRSGGLGIESYDPTTNEALIGGTGGIPQDNGVGFSKKLFAPRLGFAYQVTTSTVIRSGYGITYHSHPWGAQALRGWYPADGGRGVLGRQRLPARHDGSAPTSRRASRTRRSGPTVGIPSICCPDISTGRVPLPGVAETGYPARQPDVAPRLHPVVEPDRRAQAAGRTGRVARLRRVGVGQRLRVPRHQRLADPRLRRRGTAAVRRSSGARRPPGVGRPHAQHLPLAAGHPQSALQQTACCSRAPTPTRRPSTRPTTPTGRSSAGTRRACSIATARWRRTTFPTTSSLASSTNCRSAASKKWATTGASSAILGGWQLNGLFSAYQGRQFTLTASGASLNMPGNLQTPDQIKDDVESSATSETTARISTRSAFARVTEVRFGNVGRNTHARTRAS